MDKKDLLAIVNAIVEQVARDQNISEGEARCLVGVTLRRVGPQIAAACTVNTPQLSVVPAPAVAPVAVSA